MNAHLEFLGRPAEESSSFGGSNQLMNNPGQSLDSEVERKMIEEALRDHQRVVKKLQSKRSQLEHSLKFWQEGVANGKG
jgi:hypothetical protein